MYRFEKAVIAGSVLLFGLAAWFLVATPDETLPQHHLPPASCEVYAVRAREWKACAEDPACPCSREQALRNAYDEMYDYATCATGEKK